MVEYGSSRDRAYAQSLAPFEDPAEEAVASAAARELKMPVYEVRYVMLGGCGGKRDRDGAREKRIRGVCERHRVMRRVRPPHFELAMRLVRERIAL